MAIIKDAEYMPYRAPAAVNLEEQPAAPTFGETLQSSFARENDVVNAIDYVTRTRRPPDPNFTPQKLEETLRQRNLWGDAEYFASAKSVADVTDLAARLVTERHNTAIREKSGWTGFATDMAAGILSPTTLIPIGEGVTLASSAAKVAASAAAGAGLQEAVLEANQLTRDPNQMLMSLGSSIVMGGLLGGLAHTLTRGHLDKMRDDMVNEPGKIAISPPQPFGSLGADIVERRGGDAGSFAAEAWNRPLIEQLSKMSPVTRGIEQPHAPDFMPQGSPIMRSTTQQISQAGLRMEKNAASDIEEIMQKADLTDPNSPMVGTGNYRTEGGIAARPGGNAEDVIKTYAGPLDSALRGVEDAYKKYIFGGAGDEGAFALARAKIRGLVSKGIMNWNEFGEAASLAHATGDTNVHPMIKQAADHIDTYLQQLYKDGVEAGTYSGKEVPPGGDTRYISHLWDKNALRSDTLGAIKMFADNFNNKMQEGWSKRFEKMQGKLAKLQENIRQKNIGPTQAQFRKETYQNALDDMKANLPDHVNAAIKGIADATEELKKLGPEKEVLGADGFRIASPQEAVRQKISAAQAQGGEELAAYQAKRKEIKSNLSRLNQTYAVKDVTYRKLLNTVDANAQAQSGTIVRAAKQLNKLVNFVGTKAALKKELDKVTEEFKSARQRFEKAEARITTMVKEKDPKLSERMAAQYKTADKLAKLEDRLGKIKNFDREKFKAEIDGVMKGMADVHAEINAKRAVRNAELLKKAEKYSPEELAKMHEADLAKLKGIPDRFAQRYYNRYEGININMKTGQADFKQYAQNAAEHTVNKLLGVNRRMAYNDLIKEERGIELSRVLNVSFDQAKNWLIKDPTKIMTTATRTLAADNTLRRIFGSPDMAEQFAGMAKERTDAIKQLADLKGKDGKPLDEAAMAQKSREVHAFYDQNQKDLEVMLERMRGIRGIPRDPDAIGTRMGEAALMLNGLRFLGGAVLSSVSDPARIVQRHGLLNTFRDGFVPWITSFREMKLVHQELRAMGTANDMYVHDRLHQALDIFDDTARGTAIEKGLRFMSGKLGMVTGLDAWTQAWQTVTGGVVNAKLMNAIAIMNEGKASNKDLEYAIGYLAQRNITGDIAKTIWQNVTERGGATKVNGTWLPNTNNWDTATREGALARQAYRAAIVSEVDNTIIKPGVERPSFIDSGLPGRMLGQFRSFSLSSTQKTVMAGLQEHDMAYVNGTIISLALGGLSYYLYAQAAGGDIKAKMLKSIDDGNWELWADEAISRSGQTAIFDSAQRATSHISGLNRFTTFSGGPITKQTGSGLMSDIFGPSYDLAKTSTELIAGARNPDRRELHLARQMTPYQNLFYFRRLLDQIENAAGDAANLTGKRR